MGDRTIRVLSNFPGMAKATPADCRVNHEYLDNGTGLGATWRFIKKCFQADLIILNIDQQRLMLAGLLRWLFRLDYKLISVDLILRPPRTRVARLKAFLKKLLFSRVDRFLLYFKNIEGYQRFYGIGPDRALYIPFKVNGWETVNASPRNSEDGDYVLCSGRTLRDIKTFVKAMGSLECPGVLLQQKRELLEAHGTSAWSEALPKNIKLIIDEGDSLDTYMNFIKKARLIVIPRYKDDIAPTGISTYLVAMALNRCVLVSEGPGAEDVLTNEAVVVPAEDPSSLAEKIDLLWHDHQLRGEIASRGMEYAHSLGGEARLMSDVLRLSLLTLDQNVRLEEGPTGNHVQESGMLRKAKLLTLHSLRSLGAFDVLMRSNWRRRRLLILAYHGISQHDEHLWNPKLYMSPETFRARMELLKRSGCNVLPLTQGIELLLAEKLPERSVVITFDDGFSSLYRKAFPIVKEFDFPATVYLTSYYSGFNKPVFDVMCSYLLWKGRAGILSGSEFDSEQHFDLRTEEGRSNAAVAIRIYARDKGMSARQKDQLLYSLADRLEVDYESILAKRLLHLLSPDEVARLAAEGVDFQLHTHRHCMPSEREFFLSEVEENKAFISKLTASSPSHFCYPSGVHGPQYFPFLREAHVVSGATCEMGLASRTSHLLALPRLTDTSSLQPVEFEGWLCGAATFLPRRPIHDDEVIYPYYYERAR